MLRQEEIRLPCGVGFWPSVSVVLLFVSVSYVGGTGTERIAAHMFSC
jgi:hypothetical protein